MLPVAAGGGAEASGISGCKRTGGSQGQDGG